MVLQEANKFATDSKNITLNIKTIEDADAQPVELQYDIYGDAVVYMVHNINNGCKPPVGSLSKNFVIIPSGSSRNYVLINLDNTRKTLIDQFAEKPQKASALVVNVPDGYGGILPISMDTNDPVVYQMLHSLMDATLEQFDPIHLVTTEGIEAILVGIVDSNYKVMPLVFEDNLDNRQTVIDEVADLDGPEVDIPFSAGAVKSSNQALMDIVERDGFARIEMTAPTYARKENVRPDEITIPYEFQSNYYYVTLENTPEVEEFYRKSTVSADRGLTLVNMVTKSQFRTVTLPIGNKEILLRMRELASRVEIQPPRDSIMVITNQNEEKDELETIIVNLNNKNVLRAIEEIIKEINPKSTTTGLYNYVDLAGDLRPLVFDYNFYGEKFKDMNREIPLELKPQRIPNLGNAVPQIVFTVEDASGPRVIVLNPSDDKVFATLGRISAEGHPRHIPIPILGRGKKHMMFHLDRSNQSVIRTLIKLTTLCTPLQIPAKPIPLDDSSLVTVDISETGYDERTVVNTRDPDVMRDLLEKMKFLPMTEPLMLVLGPDGSGVKIRIDTRVLQQGTQADKDDMGCYMVVNSYKDRTIALPVTNTKVTRTLLRMAKEWVNIHGEMVVFTDRQSEVHYIRINTRDDDVVERLWKLQQSIKLNIQSPFLIVPIYSKPYYVFTVINDKGEVDVVILDTTNYRVRKQLIRMWNAKKEGTPIRIRDENYNFVTLHFDLSKRDVVNAMLSLRNETMRFHTPIIGGRCIDDVRVLKIPIFGEEKKLLAYCNISSPVVVDNLLRIHGRSVIDPKGAAFMLRDLSGEPTTMYLDLESGRVIAAVKKICPHLKTLLDPNKMLIIDRMDDMGERRTNIIDLSNKQVVNELMQRGKFITPGSRKSGRPTARTYSSAGGYEI
ncbi:hypothetical protein Trydic_g4713, partial [Trypoxylus dichotomus]